MPNLDGGHYFLTAIVPVCNQGIVEHEAMKSSPIHMVREALETLPTALQSPASEKIGIQSPFARSLRTHFARLVVLDQPFYNGRDHADAIVSAIKGVNPLDAQPVDALACPYILVMIDFDPIDLQGKGEPRSYLEELWRLMPAELTAVFRYCYGFSKVTDAASFADLIIACQVETTMPFNDYWVGAPQLPSLSQKLLLAVPLLGLVAGGLLAWWQGWPWWGGLLAALLLAILGIVIDYWLVMRQGAKPFPPAPNSTLRDVLKGLYLQQAFTRFAAARQGEDPATLGAAFRDFLKATQPADLGGPTQPPGVIRSIFPKVFP
ncbi:MAG: hypothetical protein WDN44_16050 [Sphingomonas sp.]